MDFFRQVGTVHFNSERFNISVNTSPSSAGQSLRTRPGMPSGPVAFRRVPYHLSRLNDKDKCLGMKQALAGMPKVVPQDAVSRSLMEPGLHMYLRLSSSENRVASETLGERDTHTAQASQIPAQWYPCGAHLGREDRRAWSGLHVKAIKSDKGQGRRPSRSVADVLDGNICLKGLGGRHTSS